MFTRLDNILYPDKAEVWQCSGYNIYYIFKNGSQSIHTYCKEKGWPAILNKQISKLDKIDVFLREPKERYISGVATHLYNTGKSVDSIIPGVFLDRHYLPQILWILNLLRFCNPECNIHLHHWDLLKNITPLRIRVDKLNSVDPLIADDQNLEMYMKLDAILFEEMTGNSWKPQGLMAHLMSRDPLAYFTVFGKASKLAEVTHVLPTP